MFCWSQAIWGRKLSPSFRYDILISGGSSIRDKHQYWDQSQPWYRSYPWQFYGFLKKRYSSFGQTDPQRLRPGLQSVVLRYAKLKQSGTTPSPELFVDHQDSSLSSNNLNATDNVQHTYIFVTPSTSALVRHYSVNILFETYKLKSGQHKQITEVLIALGHRVYRILSTATWGQRPFA